MKSAKADWAGNEASQGYLALLETIDIAGRYHNKSKPQTANCGSSWIRSHRVGLTSRGCEPMIPAKVDRYGILLYLVRFMSKTNGKGDECV